MTRAQIRGFYLELEGSVSGYETGALFSPDQRYRYVLWRTWDPSAFNMIVIGLNPSTADARVDDPTIRRCIAFAKRERFGGLTMLNLFALRSTDPRALAQSSDPVGPENDKYIAKYTRSADPTYTPTVVLAWGAHGVHRDRAAEVLETLPPAKCFGMTKDGHPKHPLYLRSDTPLTPFANPNREQNAQ